MFDLQNSILGQQLQKFSKARVFEHLGKSPRTNLTLSSPPFSSVRQHSIDTGHSLNEDDFKILDKCHSNLRLLESLYIYKLKPKLNLGLPIELALVG